MNGLRTHLCVWWGAKRKTITSTCISPTRKVCTVLEFWYWGYYSAHIEGTVGNSLVFGACMVAGLLALLGNISKNGKWHCNIWTCQLVPVTSRLGCWGPPLFSLAFSDRAIGVSLCMDHSSNVYNVYLILLITICLWLILNWVSFVIYLIIIIKRVVWYFDWP